MRLFLLLFISAIVLAGSLTFAANPTFSPLASQALSTAPTVFPNAPSPHRVQPTGLWGSNPPKAKPTNDWWFNLIFGQGTSPLKTYPYLFRCDNNGLTIGYPGRTTQPNYVADAFIANMAFGATQGLGQRQLTSSSKLHATLRYGGGTGSPSLTIPFVRGMPYATGLYFNLTPKITSAHAIININGQGSQPGRSVTGTKFKIGLNNGQTWLLYAEKSLTLSQTQGNILQATAPFTGYLRLAILPAANAESMLDNYADTVPMNATVSFQSASMGAPRSGASSTTEVFDLGRMIFNFKKYGNQQKPLLLYALPHHQDSLVSPQYPTTRINVGSIKGQMTAIVGDTWTLQESLTNVGFYAKYAPSSGDVNNLKSALNEEKNYRPAASDPYFGGKQVAKMARLAIMADQLGDTATATTIRNNMKSAFDVWFSPTGRNAFVFERTWGGIVSKASTSWDPAAEFGMGYYNDHHFHFGYFVYAAAVLGLKDSTWLNANKQKVIDLIRDYANPVNDNVFPQMRAKDPYLGHSFAAGLYEFADIKNQESTSEAINSYYAISLFGRALGDANIYNWGRLLLAQEVRSTMKYWHMPTSSNIYDSPFKNHKMAGIVWETKVDYATFFGANVEFIHGIQMMPFTPITEEYLPADFIREEYPVLATGLTRSNPVIPDGWKGFVYMAHAIIDKNTARREIGTLRGYDDGNGKTNTLYWVATRPESGLTRIWEPFSARSTGAGSSAPAAAAAAGTNDVNTIIQTSKSSGCPAGKQLCRDATMGYVCYNPESHVCQNGQIQAK